MRKYILVILGAIVITGCGKRSDPLPSSRLPDKAVLSLPAQNAACTTGTVISATQSSITFTWGTAANTDSYLIGIKNLLTQAIHYKKATTTQLTDTLLRNTPYSWFVVSKSTTVADTSKSEVWKFYNAGPGTVAYAPFPAEITSPTLNQNVTATGSTINLVWKGSSIDNDIVGYDVYFGTGATPVLYKSNVTDMFLNSVPVTSGTIYYWKVVTKDLIGNTSDSGVSSFKVN
jgi:hypothetical protein